MPQTRKISAMVTIRLFMNGVLPISAPVAGSRSGAQLGSVISSMKAMTPRRPQNANRRPRYSSAESVLASPIW